MEVDKVADIELDMVADMEVDININIDMEIQLRVGHGGWLIVPKPFLPEAYPACASSKLCEFIKEASM